MTTSNLTVEVPSRLRLYRRVHPALRRPLAVSGACIIAIWVIAAVFAPDIAPYKPDAISGALYKAPSSQHLFGTDQLGRDVFSRVLYATRISLPLPALMVLMSMAIGGVLGAIAGYFGGLIDAALMRLVDLVFAFPAIILALVVTAVLGPSLQNAVLALVVVSWPSYARVVRGLVLSAGSTDYVLASRLLGASSRQALARDVLPNVVGPVVVYATLDFGNAILLLAGLSFLGLGAQPPTAEWGAMVSYGTQYFQDWWMSTFPGLAIFSCVLALNFLGDSFRDALDPQGSWTANRSRP